MNACGGQIYTADEGTQAATVERAIRPEAVALALFALVLAVSALLIVGQAAVRLLITGSSDNPTLAALGMTRGQLAAAGLAQVSIAAAAGGLAAVGVAVAASPLMPIGAARLAEPAPGISADWVVLTIGPVAIMVLLLARVAWPAWRLGSAGAGGPAEPAATVRRSRAAQWLAGAGAPVTATAGVRLALEHRPRDRARYVGPPSAQASRRAVGHREGQRAPGSGPHRRPGGLPELRPRQLHADRPRTGR